ncbi:hypothetical protein [Nitrobacter sp.]|uniref:hypothetical protein n=1 Tax=Nitrobacter sp. TaxID=29420 RepID=UPI001E0B92BE|nr:hypothetical protein [Nitrobacter sp.]MCB1393707.1 hypothetical protein [Nitrobacter sp.]
MDDKSLIMIDGPEPFDTLETWEQHLKKMEALPDRTPNKQSLVKTAKRWVGIKREESFRDSRKAG